MKSKERNWTSYQDLEGLNFGIRYKYTRKQWEEQAFEWTFGYGLDEDNLENKHKEYLDYICEMGEKEFIEYISDVWSILIKETTWLEIGAHCIYNILADDFIPVVIKDIRIEDNGLPMIHCVNEDDSEDYGKEYFCYDAIDKFFMTTDKKCPKCGGALLTSDILQYDYLCVSCDENFYSSEV